MGLLDRLLSRGGGESAAGALAAAAAAEPARARKLLRRAGRTHHEVFGLGGELHDEYRRAVLACWGDAGVLPAVELAPWHSWTTPTCALVLERARHSHDEVLYLTAPGKRRTRDALAELEALRLLRDDLSLVLVTIGEEDAQLRTAFAEHSTALDHPEAEEVLQELADAAARLGLKTAFV